MEIRLNLGCGNDYKEGYTNVDLDSPLADKRCGLLWFMKSSSDNSVTEVLADHVLEHLTFEEEKEFFTNLKRILIPGGSAIIKVPDFQWLCETFLYAEENDYKFYTTGSNDDFFGGGYDADKRWSFLMATFFGHQDGKHQLHKNAYTVGKFRAIGELIDLRIKSMTPYARGKTKCIRVVYVKDHE